MLRTSERFPNAVNAAILIIAIKHGSQQEQQVQLQWAIQTGLLNQPIQFQIQCRKHRLFESFTDLNAAYNFIKIKISTLLKLFVREVKTIEFLIKNIFLWYYKRRQRGSSLFSKQRWHLRIGQYFSQQLHQQASSRPFLVESLCRNWIRLVHCPKLDSLLKMSQFENLIDLMLHTILGLNGGWSSLLAKRSQFIIL